jgi:hypothetical protein
MLGEIMPVDIGVSDPPGGIVATFRENFFGPTFFADRLDL